MVDAWYNSYENGGKAEGWSVEQDLDLATIADYLAGRDDIVAAYVFGSAAEGLAHRLSDLDVALLLPLTTGPAERLDIRLEVMAALERLSQRPADVVVLNDAPLLLRFQVLKHGRVLVDHNRTQRCLFAARTMSAYYDAQRYLDYHFAHLIRRIREDGLGAGYHGHQDTLEEARRLSARLAALSEDPP